MFSPVPANASFPQLEEATLRFWREQEIFKKSMKQREHCPQYVFYDGPPFATGLPHYGHLLAGTIKDVVPRYQTMCGAHVPRTFGWDCHGLPVENEVEKELGISSKHEIEAYGVAKFNEACRGIVLRYTREWEQIVERIGRWVDFTNGYRTMDRSYMESIWWVFKQLWDQGLVYEGRKIMWYCPRCATPLSNFEVNQGYIEVEDPAITVRFKARDAENTWFLAWTTTPWTLPANLALTVGPEIDYVEVQDGQDHFILGEALISTYWRKDPPAVLRRWKGKELAGRTYDPLFPYFENLREEGAFRIITAAFVSTDEGTGIVHTAPGFGEDDANAGKANGVPAVCPIDDEGCYTADVPEYKGRFVKDCDPDLIRRLKLEGKLVHRATYKHNYPHCWRCDAPLINKAIATWFVRVEQIRDRLLAANRQITWVPEHLKEGRFGNWLENARDWAVSRNRYWGCPLPIWRNAETGETVCVGSVRELEERSGQPVQDIHKHFVDPLTLPGRDGTVLRRVPEVLDCWFESGSMPYAQHHYPFENKTFVEQHFPADFIAEGLDQTRGWFYTLVVLGAALFDKPAFRNVVVNGLVLAEDGRKMSKRLKNYPDPMTVMNTYGADALRLCLLSSPVVRAEDLRFSEKAVREAMRTIILPLWNSYSFLVTYARVDGWEPGSAALPAAGPANLLDRWILSRLDETIAGVRESMDAYELQRAATRFTGFLDDLTNWYIRRSRRRFWKSQNDGDKLEAYATLHRVLVTFTQIAAPFIPFVTEEIYRNLRTPEMPESVHLCDFPKPCAGALDDTLNRRMARTMTVTNLGHSLRKKTEIRVRQPLRSIIVISADPVVRADLLAMADVIADELNVKQVSVAENEEDFVRLSAKANFKVLGKKMGGLMKSAAQAIEKLPQAKLSQLQCGKPVFIAIPGCTLATQQLRDMAQAGTPLPGDCPQQDENGVFLFLDDVLIQRQEKEGLTVANEGDITVALDIRLDPALLQEGWARDIINRLQTMRKEANLEVTDRIAVSYDLPAEPAAALQAFADTVAAEILAVSLTAAALPQLEPADLNGVPCRFALEKVEKGS